MLSLKKSGKLPLAVFGILPLSAASSYQTLGVQETVDHPCITVLFSKIRDISMNINKAEFTTDYRWQWIENRSTELSLK